jgi:hypothetical protein
VARLRIKAKTWLFSSEDFARAVSNVFYDLIQELRQSLQYFGQSQTRERFVSVSNIAFVCSNWSLRQCLVLHL